MEETYQPLDPQAASPDTIEEFAADLRELRQQAGQPSYRAMSVQAKRSGHKRSYNSFSEAVKGRSLPSWDTVAAFVTVCGAEPSDWMDRWEQLESISKGRSFDDGMTQATIPEAEETPVVLSQLDMEPVPPPSQPEEKTPKPQDGHTKRVYVTAVVGVLALAVIAILGHDAVPGPSPASRKKLRNYRGPEHGSEWPRRLHGRHHPCVPLHATHTILQQV